MYIYRCVYVLCLKRLWARSCAILMIKMTIKHTALLLPHFLFYKETMKLFDKIKILCLLSWSYLPKTSRNHCRELWVRNNMKETVVTYISVYFILSTKSNNVRSNRIIYLQQSTIDYNMFVFVEG